MDDIIVFNKVSKSFGGVTALKDISFSIKKGEIHAIVGENGAGKSTLMNVLSGVIIPDSGEVMIKGNPAKIDTPIAAIRLGISTVYQELKLCSNLNVIQNLFLGREETRFKLFPNWREMEKKAQNLVKTLGININIRDFIKDLTVAKMQIVEIAKALSIHAEILILDEPTSSLTIMETKKLMEIMNDLKADGMTILFISHRLEEVFELSDRITVMRNGEYLDTLETKDADANQIVNLIAGKDILADKSADHIYWDCAQNDVVLEVLNLTRGKWFENIDFKLYKGEILGFYGLQGSGRTELMETIFGLEKADNGTIIYKGQIFKARNTKDAIKNSIGMVPEDRKQHGLFMNFNIAQNVAIIHDRSILKFGFIDRHKVEKITDDFIKKFNIKCTDHNQMVKNLSGGNQQKVVLAKVMSAMPEIVFLDEPTRGIDIGTKIEIYRYLNKERQENGKTMIVVTSELKEVISECDRVIVMRNGHIAGELQKDDITENNILQLAFSG